ncbi:MAG: hypothetical protein HGA37_01575 [Lentimicrobium sp.]|nr:hypothetical protein [Lentimicrobium sp.]
MKRTIGLLTIILFAYGCSREKEDAPDRYFVGEIVSFDLNCSNCILRFPNDSITIKQAIGISRNNYYQTINLEKDTFKISQRVLVKLRKAEDRELSACITLYPSNDYRNIYIIDFKPDE